jgi:hypothetical protein
MRTILIAGILACRAAAQTLTEPPLLVQLIRRPGSDATSIRRYADARTAVEVLGMASITGPAETWLIEGHDSFASIEALDKAVRPSTSERRPDDQMDQLPGDVLAASRSLIALYRPAWSYRPDQAIRLFPKARYFLVSIYRVRPGAEADFVESVKLRRGNFDTINLDRPEIAYQVLSGAPLGTYLFLAPLTSLRTLDEGLARVAIESTTAPGAKAGNKVAPEGEISRGQLLFRVEPSMSYVSDDFASDAPDFWRPKPKDQ